MLSPQYLKLVKDTNVKNLTNSQHRFVEFLLENHTIIGQIGTYHELFDKTRDWIKDNRDEFKPEDPQQH